MTGINNRGGMCGIFQFMDENLRAQHPAAASAAGQPSLGQKVAFLSQAGSYPDAAGGVMPRETHMSWVFLTGNRVYKLKKPVRFAYLDFSTLARREAACRSELKLNRRLAADVYLEVVPLTFDPDGLAIDGTGATVDWLVVMRRLDEECTLERAILGRRLEHGPIERLAMRLVHFYRTARPAFRRPEVHLAQWRKSVRDDRQVLLDPRFGLPAGSIRRIDQVLRQFLRQRSSLLSIRAQHIVDGHGDLRPEHIWLGDAVRIIDCLEFNATLRAVDPFDEVAYLSLECERLGAPDVGAWLRRRIALALHDGLADDLFLFYRCHRAMLRAGLAIAHLAEPQPRTPEKWPRRAREYLRLAAVDAARLERCLKTRAGR